MDDLQSTTLKNISEQYNKYPYPKYSWMVKLDPQANLHATYEAGASLVFRKQEHHNGKKIALLGCGTFEPYALGVLHPQARVTAVDVSAQALKRASRRCLLHWVRNVDFQVNDVTVFCQEHPEEFDYIHSFGVLHHLENPAAGFKMVAQCLNKNGFARIMVYSSVARRRLTNLRRALLCLGAKPGSLADVGQVQAFVDCLPHDHPLRLTYRLNSDHTFASGVVDSLLHAQDKGYEWREVLDLVKAAGLQVRALDFSQNILNLLDGAGGKGTDGKIAWLEAFDQWPTSFCFWVARARSAQKNQTTETALVTHPSLKKNPRPSLPSTLLKRTITLSEEHLRILRMCSQSPRPRSFFLGNESANAIAELLSGRLLLEVSQ